MNYPFDLNSECSAVHCIAKMPTLLFEWVSGVKTAIKLSGYECSIKVAKV